MQKKYALSRISPGTTFTEDVYADKDSLMASKGIPIRKKDIEMLQAWGIRYVFSTGEPVNAMAEEPLVKKGMAVFSDKSINAIYIKLVADLKAIMDLIARNSAVEAKMVDGLAKELIELVKGREALVASAILSSQTGEVELARAGVNTAILSIIMGIALKLPQYRLMHLVCGALLHDTGMLRVPQEIVKKKGKLNPEESQKIRGHTLMSYRIITNELNYPDDVGLIALQHHERWDGEGYPRKLAGQDIDQLARIVSVADAFEAMVSQKPYRNPMIGYTAMKNLLSDNSRRFDPDVIKAFIKSMGIYPIGSLVLLNNAAIARVVESHSDAPLRPKIKIIVDEYGRHFKEDDGEVLNLLKEKTLFIAKALDPDEILQNEE